MHAHRVSPWLRVWRSWLLCLLCGQGVAALAAAPDTPSAAALRKQHTALASQLQHTVFQRPLVLRSTQTQQRLRGDIYALMPFGFEVVSPALTSPARWCDVMILHINTKYCHAAQEPAGTVLNLYIGTKTPQDIALATRIRFNFVVAQSTPDYFEVLLDAQEGPMGTSDYRIRLEVVALSPTQSFLHLTYSYEVGFVGRLAMQTYLATVGADKVGFSLLEPLPDGQPVYIDGMRGLVERNTMRYYLAINSFLQASQLPPPAQLEARLQAWFTAAEQYPRQLHDMERPVYLEMKRAEALRQQTPR